MWIFLGDDFWIFFRVQRFLVRQWIHVSSVHGGLVLGSCDRFSSCSLLFPYTAQCLVLSGTCYAAVYGVVEFHVFYVKRWITDPEVDSRLSGHVFRHLVSGSHLFVASPEEYMIWIFWEMTSRIISVCSALSSTVDTYFCQSTRLREFHIFSS